MRLEGCVHGCRGLLRTRMHDQGECGGIGKEEGDGRGCVVTPVSGGSPKEGIEEMAW